MKGNGTALQPQVDKTFTNNAHSIECQVCFGKAHTVLPQPHRAKLFTSQSSNYTSFSLPGSNMREHHGPDRCCPSSQRPGSHEQSRNERLHFKNIRLVHSPLPQTPRVRNVRRKSPPTDFYIMVLRTLCDRRHWLKPLFHTYRTVNGYRCVVRVNKKKYSTNFEHKTEELAKNEAAKRAYMIHVDSSMGNNTSTDQDPRHGEDSSRLPVATRIERRDASNSYLKWATASVASAISSEGVSGYSTRSAPQGERTRSRRRGKTCFCDRRRRRNGERCTFCDWDARNDYPHSRRNPSLTDPFQMDRYSPISTYTYDIEDARSRDRSTDRLFFDRYEHCSNRLRTGRYELDDCGSRSRMFDMYTTVDVNTLFDRLRDPPRRPSRVPRYKDTYGPFYP